MSAMRSEGLNVLVVSAAAAFHVELDRLLGAPSPAVGIPSIHVDHAGAGGASTLEDACRSIDGGLARATRYAAVVLDLDGLRAVGGAPDGVAAARRIWQADASLCLFLCTADAERAASLRDTVEGRPCRVLVMPTGAEDVDTCVRAMVGTWRATAVERGRRDAAAGALGVAIAAIHAPRASAEGELATIDSLERLRDAARAQVELVEALIEAPGTLAGRSRGLQLLHAGAAAWTRALAVAAEGVDGRGDGMPGVAGGLAARSSLTAAGDVAARPRAGVPGISVGPAETRLQGRVLLAEDSLDHQRLTSFILERAGLSVELARTGQEACRLGLAADASGTPFDVILMDIEMPRMDGVQATSYLREHGYRGPIVAMTAHSVEGREAECRRVGCDEFASKPIRCAELLAIVGRLIGPTAATVGGEGVPAGTRGGEASVAGVAGPGAGGPVDAR